MAQAKSVPGVAEVGGDVELDVRLETPLPTALPAGCRTAVFVLGSCFHRRHAIRRLELVVDGVAGPVTAHSMPRLDLYRALHPTLGIRERADSDPASSDDPELRCYKSGFWATVPIAMPAAGRAELSLRATLGDGERIDVAMGAVDVAVDELNGSRPTAPDPEVAIAMATFEPDLDLFAAQIASIRDQTLGDWICILSDDCSPPDTFERMRAVVGDDPRFIVTRSPRRLGFYRNFERALRLVPPGARYVALADQDDRWYPDKLATLVDRLGDANLVYSDQRVVGIDGAILADTYWIGRENNHTNFASLLIANTVTGAASLFRRDLLDTALPFPAPPGTQYHDHWLALVALATGRIAYVDRPLYDYVQHGGSLLGHGAANEAGGGRLRTAAMWVRNGDWRRIFVGWRSAYFFAYCRLRLLAEVLLLRGGSIVPRKTRRTLRRLIRAERSPLAFSWLVARSFRRLAGRDETLGAETLVARGVAWRYIVAAIAARRRTPGRGASHDASYSPESANLNVIRVAHPPTRALAKLIQPLPLSISTQAPQRVNLLVPTVELRHFFGGYITKFNLARKLVDNGIRTRIVTVDETPPLPRSWRREVESYAGLEGMFEAVEVAFGRDRDAPIDVNPNDAFIATTWWTAEIAHAALRSLNRTRFLYLIQEYEPYTFPMGSWAALADTTYSYPHAAMFSTELLRDFFASRGYGVYADGRDAGDAASVAFQNAITAVSPPTAETMARRERKRLLFYARPEAHGARNMFELGLLALSEAVARGVFGPEWDLHGIGTVEGRDRIHLGSFRQLELLPKRDQAAYAELLTEHDVGLALMSTPHPSLVPLEMASAGMLTVTNTFDTKTRDAMSAISPNLIAMPPSPGGVLAGLEEAAREVGDYGRRIAGAEVDWSRDWDTSLNAELMRRVIELIEAT